MTKGLDDPVSEDRWDRPREKLRVELDLTAKFLAKPPPAPLRSETHPFEGMGPFPLNLGRSWEGSEYGYGLGVGLWARLQIPGTKHEKWISPEHRHPRITDVAELAAAIATATGEELDAVRAAINDTVDHHGAPEDYRLN